MIANGHFSAGKRRIAWGICRRHVFGFPAWLFVLSFFGFGCCRKHCEFWLLRCCMRFCDVQVWYAQNCANNDVFAHEVQPTLQIPRFSTRCPKNLEAVSVWSLESYWSFFGFCYGFLARAFARNTVVKLQGGCKVACTLGMHKATQILFFLQMNCLEQMQIPWSWARVQAAFWARGG